MFTFLNRIKEKMINVIQMRFKFTDNLIHSKQTNVQQVSSFEQQMIKKYGGRLLLRHEIKLTDEQLQMALKNGTISKINAIEKKLFHYKCHRCFNTRQSLFANMFCLHCEKEVTYCRHCIEMGRVMSCDFLYTITGHSLLWPKHHTPCTWQGTLNEYQQTAANRLLINMKKRKDILVWSVTGSGKTEMIFPVITKALQTGKRICVATPRKDVVRELYPRFEAAFKHIDILALYGGSKEKSRQTQFVIATTHQLIRFKRAFDILIIDEVDAFPYHNDKLLPLITERARKKTGMTIYLTATPRNEQKWQMRLNKLDYIFVPVRYHEHPLPIPKLIHSFTLSTQLKRNNVPQILLTTIKGRSNLKRQLLIFVPTIKLATKLTPQLTKILQQKSIIPNETYIRSVHAKDENREQTINLFRNKRLTVLLTTTILERGVTFPSIDVIVLHACHPVFDEAALVQIAGRAGRSKEDPIGDVFFIYEHKTEAVIKAKEMIEQMNKRAKKMKG